MKAYNVSARHLPVRQHYSDAIYLAKFHVQSGLVMAAASLLLGILVIIYWRSRYVATHGKMIGPSLVLVTLSVSMLALISYAGHINQWDAVGRSGKAPIALAMVFDTSLSMYAGPDPTRYPEVKTRFDRSKEVVLDVLQRLDEGRSNTIASIVVFTVRAANALGWNPNLQEVAQIVDKSLTTNLIGRGGTDLGGALARTMEVFDSLSERLQSSASKVLLLVSDGERTVNMVDLDENLMAFRQRGIRIISLQVGLLDEPEGIREYDEFGFTGFWKGIGETYTVPDTGTMISVAGLDDSQGLYIRAEDPMASLRILGFLQGETGVLSNSISRNTVMILGLWFLSTLMLARLLA